MLSAKDITLEQQIACVERELSYRRRLYPAWIERRKITADEARTQIVSMEAVLETLQRAKAGGQGQAELPMG